MIILWRPSMTAIRERDWERYRHTWTRQAESWGEFVVEQWLNEGNERLQWDRINGQSGRYVIWVRPEFIPWPTFRDELDVYREEDQFIVLLQSYRAVFQLKQYVPSVWEAEGISRALVVFQLAGQETHLLPSSNRVDIWEWLEGRKAWIYRLAQRFVGGEEEGLRSRSLLGEVVYGLWSDPRVGHWATGGAVWADSERQLGVWRTMIEGWEKYIERGRHAKR